MNIDEENLKILYRSREILDQSRIKHSDALDKYLLSFATGSLYLSISFTEGLDKVVKFYCLLGIGWALLVFSIISILMSFYFGAKAHMREMKICDDRIKKIGNGQDPYDVNVENVWNRLIEGLNLFSIVTFVMGVALLTIFYFINL